MADNILVTGKHGTDHITSAQTRSIQAGMFGQGQYVCNGLECTMTDANTAHIAPGTAMMNGGGVVVEGSGKDLTITSGMTGRNRNDLIVIRYTKTTTTSLEDGHLEVITGTPTTGTAADSSYNKGNLLEGTSQVDFPLYRVEVRGITTPHPVALYSKVPSLAELGDSISSIVEDVRGKIHVSPGWWETNYIRATKIGNRVFLNFHVKRIGGVRYDMKAWEEELLFDLDESIQPVSENVLLPAMTNMNLYNGINGMQMLKACPSGIKFMCTAEIDINTNSWVAGFCSWEIGK